MSQIRIWGDCVGARTGHRARASPIVVVLAASLAAQETAAQDTTTVKHGEWVIGGSVGVPIYAWLPLPSAFTVSVHGTHVRPGGLGADLSAGIMPRALVEGIFVSIARAGLTFPVTLSENAFLLPSGGVSLFGGFGPGGGGTGQGVNVGATMLAFGEGRIGFRAGLTWHRIRGTGDAPIWLIELGLVRRRRTP